jgi:Holliday junction resolvase RusA-like endonuclease
MTKTISFVVPGVPIGKPRMTQRDKWMKRPCVLRYRAYADAIRRACPNPPPAEQTVFVEVFARFEPPVSWSKSKREKAIGTLKRTKPDGDNCEKGIFDAMWGRDEKLGDQFVNRTWWPVNETMIRITFNPEVQP